MFELPNIKFSIKNDYYFRMVGFFKFNNSGTVFCIVNASAYEGKMLLANFTFICQIFLEIFLKNRQHRSICTACIKPMFSYPILFLFDKKFVYTLF